MSRRGMLDLGLVAAASAMLPRPGRALPSRWSGPQPGDAFVAADGARDGALLLAALQAGAAPVLAWPIDRRTYLVRDGTPSNLVLLLRPASGDVAAFSALCQHAGCVVSGWLATERLLLCPCHGSRYDPARQGAVVAGPAPLALPMLPVQVAEGTLLVVGPFSAPVGGHTGRTD